MVRPALKAPSQASPGSLNKVKFPEGRSQTPEAVGLISHR